MNIDPTAAITLTSILAIFYLYSIAIRRKRRKYNKEFTIKDGYWNRGYVNLCHDCKGIYGTVYYSNKCWGRIYRCGSCDAKYHKS
jgi:hypothetical protein